jgi:hypothetical protein
MGELDGNRPGKASVARPIDFPHSTSAEHRNDFVGSDTGARGNAHWGMELRRLYDRRIHRIGAEFLLSSVSPFYASSPLSPAPSRFGGWERHRKDQ